MSNLINGGALIAGHGHSSPLLPSLLHPHWLVVIDCVVWLHACLCREFVEEANTAIEPYVGRHLLGIKHLIWHPGCSRWNLKCIIFNFGMSGKNVTYPTFWLRTSEHSTYSTPWLRTSERTTYWTSWLRIPQPIHLLGYKLWNTRPRQLPGYKRRITQPIQLPGYKRRNM